MLKEFREFALKGNALDMAVGIVIGAAFGAIVNSLVNDVLMPPIGILLGSVDFSDLFLTLKEGASEGPYPSLKAAQNAGAVTVNLGAFINSIISFLIVAFSVFLVVKNFNRLREKMEGPKDKTTRSCPECCLSIPINATRCPNCTSSLK